jgi:hypothetical protein
MMNRTSASLLARQIPMRNRTESITGGIESTDVLTSTQICNRTSENRGREKRGIGKTLENQRVQRLPNRGVRSGLNIYGREP